MFAHLLFVFADAANQAGGGQAGGGGNPAPTSPFGGYDMIFVMGAIMLVGYLLLVRPMKRQEADRQAMAKNLRKNDKVLTTAGIYGTVITASETEDEVVVKVDDNTRLRMLKGSIARNLTREEEAAQAAKEAKEAKAK
jgi:preprotein translocase subunit YajC